MRAAASSDDADERMSLKERLSRAAALSALVSTLTTSGVEMDAFAAANAKKSAAPMPSPTPAALQRPAAEAVRPRAQRPTGRRQRREFEQRTQPLPAAGLRRVRTEPVASAPGAVAGHEGSG